MQATLRLGPRPVGLRFVRRLRVVLVRWLRARLREESPVLDQAAPRSRIRPPVEDRARVDGGIDSHVASRRSSRRTRATSHARPKSAFTPGRVRTMIVADPEARAERNAQARETGHHEREGVARPLLHARRREQVEDGEDDHQHRHHDAEHHHDARRDLLVVRATVRAGGAFATTAAMTTK